MEVERIWLVLKSSGKIKWGLQGAGLAVNGTGTSFGG